MMSDFRVLGLGLGLGLELGLGLSRRSRSTSSLFSKKAAPEVVPWEVEVY